MSFNKKIVNNKNTSSTGCSVKSATSRDQRKKKGILELLVSPSAIKIEGYTVLETLIIANQISGISKGKSRARTSMSLCNEASQ